MGLAAGLNVYGFAAGDPVNFDDPFGLECKDKNGKSIPENECHPDDKGLTTPLLDPVAIASGAAAGLLIGAVVGAAEAEAADLEGTALARAAGKAGEEASGLVKNATRIPSATGTAAYRVPDGLTETTLSEVKNVARLSATNQLRDFAAYASEKGLNFDLYVRPNTRLSAPLQKLILENKTNLIRNINP